MAERREANWRGVPAWRVDAEDLRVLVCPERGAKVMSAFHVSTGRDFLLPAPLRPPRPLTYGSLWTAYDACGWDDAFPTLGECAYPGAGRLAGVRLPDHGEVWSRPWSDHSTDGDAAVALSIQGLALPYLLHKRVAVVDHTLRLDYELLNEGDEAMPFQWAAFPLFARRFIDHEDGGDGWAGFADTERGAWQRLDWDPALVPSLSRHEAEDWIALCPGIGDGADLEAAVDNGSARVVDPGQSFRWWVALTAGCGDNYFNSS